MRKILLFILLTIFSLNIYTQDSNLDYNISSRHLSPQAYEFARYGNTPAKHFVGELDLSIPLYTYQDKDFTIPITLQYNGTGFMPNKNEGLIGLDWSLNVGGAITRQINGAPDEERAVESRGVIGVLLASKSGYYKYDIPFNEKLENDNLKDLLNGIGLIPSHVNPSVPGSAVNEADLASDEFNFHMLEHSGKFNIGWDGKAQVRGNKPYQVIFDSDFTTSTSDLEGITIISPDGYKYIFGNTKNAIETSTSFLRRGNMSHQRTVSTAWFLTQIIAPNGRKVKLIYKEVKSREGTGSGIGSAGYLSGDISLYLKKNLIGTTSVNLVDEQHSYVTVPNSTGSNRENFTYEVIRYSSLDKIVIDNNTVISFSYKEKENKFYSNDEIYRDDLRIFNSAKNRQMTGISVKYDNNPIKSISLEQQYLGSSDSKRLFLTSVLAGNEKYTFDYYNLDKIPKASPDLVDHWGYYNGSRIVVPELKATLYDLNTIIDSDKGRTGNEELSKVGSLRRVVYPTGGGSIFHYGLHHWDYHVRKSGTVKETVGQYYIGQPFSKEVGGARINKIEDFNENGDIINVKEFTYNNAILLQYPQYVQDIYSMNNVLAIRCFTNPLGSGIYPSEKYIQYGEVIEKTLGNGSTIYHFSSYLEEENRDIFDINPKSIVYDDHKNVPKTPVLIDMKGADRSYRRGLLEEKIYCNNTNDTIYKEKFNYELQNSSLNNYLIAVRMGEYLTHKYKIENYAYLPVEKKNYEYRNGQQILTTTQTEYNDKYLVKKEVNVENSLTTEYEYPYDVKTISPYNEMVNQNILMPILKKKVSKGETFLYEHSTDYTENRFNTEKLYLPSATYSKHNGESAKRVHTTFHKYDSYGNSVAITNKEGISSVYLWSYQGLYPVTTIENATYSEVKTALGNINPESLSSASIPNMVLIDGLRSHSSLKNALITSYIYSPLVGLITAKNPIGITTNYSYDEFNRLKTIKDHDTKTSSTYTYNLFPYPQVTFSFSARKEYSMRYNVSFRAYADGGSEQFSYSWILKDASNNILKTEEENNSDSFSYKFSDPGIATIECTIKDINSGKSKTFIETFEVKIYPVRFPLVAGSLYALNTSESFKVYTIDGGSGNFSYQWYLKDTSGKILSSSTTQLFNITFNRIGDMKLICQVKDLKTGLVTENICDFIVKYFDASLSYTSPQYIGKDANIMAVLRGGSGDFSYSWKLIDVETNTIVKEYQGHNADNKFITQFDKIGLMEVVCTVTDNAYNVTEELRRKVEITQPPIEFINIKESGSLESGEMLISADIYCSEASTMKFTLGYNGSGALASMYAIGPNRFEYLESGSYVKEITLPKGITEVRLTLRKPITAPTCNAWITIDEITGGTNVIGENRVLNLVMRGVLKDNIDQEQKEQSIDFDHYRNQSEK